MSVRVDTISNTSIETPRGPLPAHVARPGQEQGHENGRPGHLAQWTGVKIGDEVGV